MSDPTSPTPSLPAVLPVLALLGLQDPDEGDWSRLRALQFAHINDTSRLRVLVHAICATAALTLYAGSAPLWLMGVFVAILATGLHLSSRVDIQLTANERPRLTREDLNGKARMTAVVAAAWCVPICGFALFGGDAERASVALLIAVLLIGSSLALGVAPIVTVVFGAITGLASIVMFVVFGQYVMAAAIVALLAVVAVGISTVSRIHLTACLAEAGNAEKSEVVSLLLREFEENQADWLWQIDTNRLVRSASPRFAFALGRPVEEIDGKPFLELISGEAWETGQFPASLHDLAERLKRRESFSNLLVKVAIGREHRWWELSGTPMLDDNGSYLGIRGVGSDVTEQRELSDKIAYLARYDTLTGLPNRLMLTEALGDALRFAEQWRTRCAFLMIDLDRFKAVNDSLGHQVGDKLLAQVAARIKALMGENELCGRLGGDEFADRDPRCQRTRLHRAGRAQRYQPPLAAVRGGSSHALRRRQRRLGDRPARRLHGRGADAQRRPRAVSCEGRGRQRTPQLRARAPRQCRGTPPARIRAAPRAREPRARPRTTSRWSTPMPRTWSASRRWCAGTARCTGRSAPSSSCRIAEDTRLIVPIGTWVMEQACREATRWPEHIRIAVNVSPEQLFEPDFATTVVRALSASGLEARRLELEVTESIFLRDASVARASLEQCMALGCTVALDDFGTGYSSLGYLRKIRFSTIKVDRSFVQGAAQGSKESLAIIRAVVAMAESLEMSTTAEGVESAEEAEMIRRLGCTKIQGYYFGRPMRAEDALQLFRRRSTDMPTRLTA